MSRPTPDPGPLLFLAALLLLPAAGCMQVQSRSSTWDDFADRYAAQGYDVQGMNRYRPRGAGATQQRAARRSVQVASFTGEGRRREAREAANRLRLDHEIPGVWYAEVGEASVLYAGRHLRPGDSEALERLLRSVKKIREGGGRPYAGAEIVSLARAGGAVGGSGDPADLRNHPGRYSLQIANYDQNHSQERHEAAEAHARRLNEQDELAFYYHGPYRSLVTVGLFTERDFVNVPSAVGNFSNQAYGPAIEALQKKYPHNLSNGKPLMVAAPGGGAKVPQSSGVVRSR